MDKDDFEAGEGATRTKTVDEKLMQQSCRVALAAYLHDLGKFAERAGIFGQDPQLDAHLQLYCPWHEKGGWFSHRHAAHTALAFDVIERHLPDLLGISDGDASPFVGRTRAEDDSDVEPAELDDQRRGGAPQA